MADNQKWSTNISRRSVLQGVTCAVVATPIILATTYPAASAAKMSQSSVGYRDSPNGNQSCANCKLFVAPSSCKSVEDPISANGWCKIWVKA